MKRIFTTFIIALFIANTFASINVYAPNLIAPADSAVKQDVNVLLNWSPVAGAMSYKIWIDTDSLFSNPIILTSNYSAKQADQLLFDTQHFWKVQAIGNSSTDTSDWSIVRSFFTIAIPEHVSPLDSAINQSPKLMLKWKALNGVKFYDIICDTTPLFNSPLLIEKEVNLSVTPHQAQMQGTTVLYYYSDVEVSSLHFNTSYYWSVRARHDFDTSDYTPPYLLTVLDTLILSLPTDSAIDKAPKEELRWVGIDGATKYEVILDTVSTFDSPLIFIKYSTTNFTFTDTLNFGQLYFWKVRAIHNLDTTQFSTVFSFTTISKPALTSPNDNATSVNIHPTLKWQAIAGVTEYDILLADNPAFNTPMIFTTPDSVSEIYINNFTLTLNQTYYWKVKALHTRDTSDYSVTRSFTTGNTGIDNLTAIEKISIYPNPAAEKINIEITSEKNTSMELKILDITGRIIFEEIISVVKGYNVKQINLSTLNHGIYIVSIKNEGVNFNKKLIVNN